ncbi:MAG: MBL fold metallo-hydrolase [Chloroflexi bacterium]|nr:MBL fold metallo-hydrolase [Chloroflexota bacterium]
MTVLDIGQGDSMLLEGDRGSRILVDGGPDPDRLATLLDERIPAWDRRIDVVVLTHPHEDHVAGLALLLQRYRVPVVAEPGMIGSGPGDREFRAVTARLAPQRVVLAAGDRLRLDGAAITILWPRPGEVPVRPPDGGTSVNNVSIVMDIRYGARRLLLAGDMEEEVDPALVAGGALGDMPVDVLKVAHHGSRTASTATFLASIAPRVAVVSAGRDNPYGHPAPETVERLNDTGARVLRTDVDGTVTVSTDGRDLSVSTTGGRASASVPGPDASRGIIATGGGSPYAGVPWASGLLCSVPIRPDDPLPSPEPRVARGTQDQPRRSASAMGRTKLVRAAGDDVTAAISDLRDRQGGACYDRPRAHPLTARSARRPRRPAAGRPARAPFGGRRGDRYLPGCMHRGARHQDRPSADGERGPPARHG